MFPGVRERGGVAEHDDRARVDRPLAEEVGKRDEGRASGTVISLLVPGSHSCRGRLEELLRVRSFGV